MPPTSVDAHLMIVILLHLVKDHLLFWDLVHRLGQLAVGHTMSFPNWSMNIWGFPGMGVAPKWMLCNGRFHLEMDDD